ncbi:Protein kinase domain-containing protein 33 [Elsinoe fawcettii]|nr:Protein kinase domain-containing protein 33 [Elsinoe fawcettii]
MLPKTLLLSTLLPSALAVSLADFAPRASNLPSPCQSLYSSSIPMCQPTDFQTQKCSKDCVNALNALRTSVSKACKGVTGHNILAALMAGRGTQDLCPNAGDYDDDDDDKPTTTQAPPLATSTTAPPPPSTTSSSAPPPSTTSSSSEDSSSSASTTVAVITNTVIPQPSDTAVPTSIEFDTNTPSEVAATATRTTSRGAAATQSVNQGGTLFGGSAEPASSENEPSTKSQSSAIREESKPPSYGNDEYHPVRPGDMYDGRYEVVAKLGYGTSSAIWPAEDLQRSLNPIRWFRKNYAALKFLTVSASSGCAIADEVAVSKRLAVKSFWHPGKQHVRHALRTFNVVAGGSRHACIVYEPMRESLTTFKRHFVSGMLPPALMAPILEMLLLGLDYMHSSCKLIHTDLQSANILVGIEDPTIIQELLDHVKTQHPYEKANEQVVLTSCHFGALRGVPPNLKIADFGGTVSAETKHSHRIQPDRLRAPEVTLRGDWDEAADIRNAGVMMWDFLEGKPLFDATDPKTGQYDPILHLQEMQALLGPPPRSLLEKCRASKTLYDQEGNMLQKRTSLKQRTLADTITRLQDREKEAFLNVMKRTLQWDPDDRPSAAELLQDPYVKTP